MGAQNLPRWAIAEGVKALPYLGWRFVGFAPFRLVVLEVIVVGNGLAPFRFNVENNHQRKHFCIIPIGRAAEGVKPLPYLDWLFVG